MRYGTGRSDTKIEVSNLLKCNSSVAETVFTVKRTVVVPIHANWKQTSK